MAPSCKEAIKSFEERKGVTAGEAEKVEIYGQCPPLEKMDAGLSVLKNCRHLALSTNNIERISNLNGLENLKILSLSRNCIKKIENLDPVAESLEQLWMSYNVLQTLGGIEKLQNLKVLYLSNNKIASWNEIDRLIPLASLEDLLLVGNPLYNEFRDNNALSEYRVEVVKRLPNLRKLDGIPIDVDEREQAAAAAKA